MKIWLFVLSVITGSIAAHGQPCSLRLSGHVEDTDTREKLVSAVVTIIELNRQLVTDTTGDFVFDNLCPGVYTLTITHINCKPLEQKVKMNGRKHLDLLLPHSKNTLSEVVVEGRKQVPNTGFRQELSGRVLDETKGMSLSEALSKINGVTLLQTGSTISKPVIHGLHSNRILTINNGVRQEGQQWGNEHAPEIDPFIADKLVVIKGVDELRYGSDAIGGVILVEPRALRNTPGYAAELNTAYFTNNMQYVVSGVFEQQLKKQPAFRYRLQGTFKKGANVTTSGYRLNNTGSEEKNFSLTAGWKKDRFNTELFYSHFATKLGIFTGSHIGNLTDLQNAIETSRPNDVFLGEKTYTIRRPYQDVAHHLLKLKTNFYKGEHKFNLLLAGQFNHRKEYDIVRSSSNTKPQLDLSIYTLSQDLNWEHPKRSNFSGVIGLSAMQQDNSYTGRYFIPNYRAYTFGGYAIEKWSKHQWELQAGIRYDHKTINTIRLKYNGDSINHDFSFPTFAFSFNIIYKASDLWKFNTNIALASRAPHVNELLSDGIHHGTATYERGDINLKPERSVNIAAGINFQNRKRTLGVDLNVYSNNVKDFIYQQPQPDSPVLTIAGAFPLIGYKQTDAVLTGADIAVQLQPVHWLEYNSKASILYAWNKTLNDWLILMPSNRFSHELKYNFNNGRRISNSYVSGEVTTVLQQTRIPGEQHGKQDYKQPPPAYSLVNMNAAATILISKWPVTLGLGVRNLLNTKYRDYLNSMRYFSDEMGRNISIRLKVPFNHTYSY